MNTQILVILHNGKSTYMCGEDENDSLLIVLIFRESLLSFSPSVKVVLLLKMLCAACYCYISQTSDSEVTHSIFCTIEYDRAQNGMCGRAKRQRLTGGEEAADKEGVGWGVVWSHLPLLMQMTK